MTTIPAGVYDATVVVDPTTNLGWAVNLRGTVIAAAFVGPYTPARGDVVRVFIFDGIATVLGQINQKAPAAYGTVISASGGTAQVSTETGTVAAYYAGTAPTAGTFVRLSWATSKPWIAASISAIPADPGGGGPAPPSAPIIRTSSIPAIRSGNYQEQDPPGGFSPRFEDGWPEQGPAAAGLGSSVLVYTGTWLYPQASLKALTGKTITSVRIYLPSRWRGAGYTTSTIAVRFCTANQTFPPTGVADETLVAIPYSWRGGWVSLPVAFGNSLKNGGMVILNPDGTGTLGADSAAFASIDADPRSGQLEIKWRT